jgi:dTDP-4-amino-4,6-dideoxygalactose transaminase
MILMNDFKAEPIELRDAMISAAKRVIDSGWYVLGHEVKNFENQWASLCGVRNAIGVGNGMDAIEIVLRSLDIGPGDEVITTPMTAFATVLAIIRSGATPVLADIEYHTALLSKESMLRCVSPKTKAIVLVHLYGQIRDMIDWQKICEDQKIYLIEDCAQSHLAILDGKVAGSFGIAGCYSFYPTKNLGAIGDAGAVITDNDNLADRAFKLRNYGQSIRYHHPELGMNSRLDEIQAAMLCERIKWLELFTERRRQIADEYHAKINHSGISLMAPPQERSAHSYHLFVIKTEKRDALQRHLESYKVQALIHYPVPVHYQDACNEIKRDPRGLSSSESHAKQCLSIPCHPQMTDVDIEQVIDAIHTFEVK